ncbi:mitochondrial inner membrane i-AAA protease complex subunit Yme1 [Schizosaccharomyces pombe]|uniref:ATP-dependent zinc metalloprotease YME1 homolog n=1 Tax=Schizosaccharomyces pombe (strain 972 / ATCC 24843) TaxID=284812 RepID=YME1_SCHPO|nr:putative i-AAA protease Yme1 [Schizosaccharomyces pombe]O59824.1 RecName: Full=ATP-dependent zinc metalloprotease YME1 homolog [Schizosaccharomyces pombe 972h-]CAA19064.1 mitochondrial inner membrane i-AAA protease complex subunit Yme1 (predicted) [Schizosaccharomyces pombe]|eukprot:NP_588514.1 putative i-AAA protease Yme1 [Schizosaccharomyces pombe]
MSRVLHPIFLFGKTSFLYSGCSKFGGRLFNNSIVHGWLRTRSYALASGLHPLRKQKLAHFEDLANANMSDPYMQAKLYKELADNFPEAIISRYETQGVARNSACDRYYQEALRKKSWSRSLSNNISLSQSSSSPATSSFSDPKAFSAGVPKFTSDTSSTVSSTPSLNHSLQNSMPPSTPTPPPVWAPTIVSSALGTSSKTPVYVVVDEPRFTKFFRIFKFIAGLSVASYFVLLGMSIFAETSGLNNIMTNTTEQEPMEERAINVRFSDVQGVDEAKEELEEIVDFLRDPTHFTRLGGKLPRGVLLTGPPGTGKTMLARAVAGEANVPFFFMSGSQFDEMYVGVGAKRVRELFAAARKQAPSIIFIDELDAIGQKRNARDAAHMRQTLNQLLVDLDGFSKNEDLAHPVVFIGATNFPESLDPALTRPGRFDRHIHVPLPDVRGRLAILLQHTRHVPLGKDVDLSIIARGTSGFAGADLANLINQAAVYASKNLSTAVSMRDLEWSKDRILMGAERKSAFITPENKLMTAYHEGGHALVALFTKNAMRPYKATIMPRGSSLGMTISLPDMDKDSWTREEYLAMLDVTMGGRAAEELLYGKDKITSGAHNDIDKATQVARRMVTEFGMSDRIGPVSLEAEMDNLSPATRALVESEIKSLLEASYERSLSLLKSHKKELDALATALVDYEFLTAEEMNRVVKGDRDLLRNKLS